MVILVSLDRHTSRLESLFKSNNSTVYILASSSDLFISDLEPEKFCPLLNQVYNS